MPIHLQSCILQYIYDRTASSRTNAFLPCSSAKQQHIHLSILAHMMLQLIIVSNCETTRKWDFIFSTLNVSAKSKTVHIMMPKIQQCKISNCKQKMIVHSLATKSDTSSCNNTIYWLKQCQTPKWFKSFFPFFVSYFNNLRSELTFLMNAVSIRHYQLFYRIKIKYQSDRVHAHNSQKSQYLISFIINILWDSCYAVTVCEFCVTKTYVTCHRYQLYQQINIKPVTHVSTIRPSNIEFCVCILKYSSLSIGE